MQTRRKFFQLLIFLGTLSLAPLSFLGCNATTVWQQIQLWVPVGIAAFEQILTLVAPLAAPGIDAIAELIKAGFASLAAAIDQYLNAPAASKDTLAQKIILIFNDITANIQSFITALGQSANPVVKIAVALINIIVSTIEGFLNQIMPTPPAPATLKVGRETVTVNPVKRDRKQFVADFNEVCNANGHPELDIK
jgi:phage-related protein